MALDIYNIQRPRKFKDMYKTSDVVSFQAQVDASLAGESSGSLSHALLFSSDYPGLGKTTSGRIIASELNPNITDSERDAIFSGQRNPVCFELNIADVRKIDDARKLDAQIAELRDSMHPYNYVFILDEIHKMGADAQDVLLKTVENIPPNVYIICTTTGISGINEALRSRLETHNFFPLSRQLTTNLLLDITKASGYEIIPDGRVTDKIYDLTGGAPRASIVALGNFLKTGVVPSSVDEEDVADFTKLVELMVNAVRGVGNVRFSSTIAPYAYKLCHKHKAEEIRIQILFRIGRLITETASAPVARLYYEMIEEFKEPILAQPETTLFVLKLYQVYIRAKNLHIPRSYETKPETDKAD